MQTDRFEQLRKKSLEKIFETKKITSTWRDTVRNQMRQLDFQDFYDSYDLNYNIEARSKSLQSEILKGNYRSSNPLIYRLEKKLGICRHIVIPNAIDALVLQILVEDITDEILKKQPSKNSYYSRDKHQKGTLNGMHNSNDLKNLWKKMQKQIYKFQDEKNLIVVTDLSNYYDTIYIDELRKVLTSYCNIEEVTQDIMFKIIEDISWRPDYLPYSRRGLPTSNIESVRLLAHSFLFEVDDILKIKCSENFTRWMDDITFAVDEKKEAVKVINSISDLLKSRGLALNISKTKIFSKSQASAEFLIEENRFIDQSEKTYSSGLNPDIPAILESFEKHIEENANRKYYDKVSKRYLTLLSKVDYESAYKFLKNLYLDLPQLRAHILWFLNVNGFNPKSSQVIKEIIDDLEIFDDISLYQISKLMCQWEIAETSANNTFISVVDKKIEQIFISNKTLLNYLSVLMLKTKYSHQEDLFRFIMYWKAIWEDNSYGRRQVMACMARLMHSSLKSDVIKLIRSNMSSGILSVLTICTQIFEFSKIEKLDRRLTFYLFPNSKSKPYPFYKFLVLCSILNSEHMRKDPFIISKIKEGITDPFYLKWIRDQYNIK